MADATPKKFLKLENVRVAFLAAHEPKPVGKSGDAALRYSCVVIIEADSENDKAVMRKIASVAKLKWEEKSGQVLKNLAMKDRIAYKRRDFTNTEGEIYEGFEGCYALSVSNSVQPQLRDRDGSELTKATGRPYSGCVVNIWVDIWAQDNSFGQRINGTFSGMQFVSDAPAFGKGGAIDESEFEDLGVNDVDSELEGADVDPDSAVSDDDLSKFL